METKENIKKIALEFLRGKFTGTVATVNSNSEPHASTVYFAVRDDFTVYFSTSHTTSKFKNIVLNPNVAFSVGVGPEYRTFQLRGTAKFLYDKEQEQGLELLQEVQKIHPLEDWPIKSINKLKEGGSVMVEITPSYITFLDMVTPRGPGESPMYQLIP